MLPQDHSKRLGNLVRHHAGHGRFLPLYPETVLNLLIFHHPVDIHYAGCCGKNILDLLTDGTLHLQIGAIHFRHKGRHDGRSGRYFHHFYIGIVLVANALDQGPDALRDVVALVGP